MIDVDMTQRLGDFALDVKFSADAPIVGLFGASGSGKTSVINAIAGVGKPSRGTIRVNGTVLFDSATGVDVPPEHRRVGYVFQDALLFPHLDVRGNLLYGQRLRAPSEHFVDEKRVVDLLGIEALLRSQAADAERRREATGCDRPCASGTAAHPAHGRAARVARHAAQAGDPRLHRAPARRVRIPIVYVTHAVEELARVADTVVVLSDGRCAAVGEVNEVIGRPL